MRWRSLALAGALAAAHPLGAQTADSSRAGSGPSRLTLRGRFREEMAVRVGGDAGMSKVRSAAWVNGALRLSDAVTARAQLRGWWDDVYSLAGGYPSAVARDQRFDLSLREAAVAISSGALDLTLGRQQIVWGEALGTFVTDVVNPRDLREFVLPDFAELRVPLAAADARYTVGNALVLEGVWTPEVQVNRYAKPGGEFDLLRLPPSSSSLVVRPEQKPAQSLANSGRGGRVSYLVDGWDLSALYYHAVDPTPIVLRTVAAPDSGAPVITLTPVHRPYSVAGWTLGKSIEPAVVRSEVAYTRGRFYQSSDRAAPGGVERHDSFDALLGVDYTLGALDLGVQASQKILLGTTRVVAGRGIDGRVSTSVAFRAATTVRDNRIGLNALSVIDAAHRDWRTSPRAEYTPDGALTAAVGADLFHGAASTLYGEFATRDRVYVEVGWRF